MDFSSMNFIKKYKLIPYLGVLFLFTVGIVQLKQNTMPIGAYEVQEQYISNLINEQYKLSAFDKIPIAKRALIAGSGIIGNRDGIGPYAQFVEPGSMVMDTNKDFLYVLDGKSQLVRKIELSSRIVSTIVDLKQFNIRFKSVAIVNQNFYFIDESEESIYKLEPNGVVSSILSVKNEKQTKIKDLVVSKGLLFALLTEQTTLKSKILNKVGNKWQVFIDGINGLNDRLYLFNKDIFLTSKANKQYTQISLENGLRNDHTVKVEFLPLGIIADPLNSRYIGYSEKKMYQLSYPVITENQYEYLPIHNINGDEVGVQAGHVEIEDFEYNKSPFFKITEIVAVPEKGDFYVCDGNSKRIIYHSTRAKQRDQLPNFIKEKKRNSTIMNAHKTLWIGHSVSWCPAGRYYNNNSDEYGAPKVFETLLKEQYGESFSVTNPKVTGVNFFHGAYNSLKSSLEQHNYKNAVVLIDLHNLLWFFHFNLKPIPLFENNTIPIGIDAESATKKFQELVYPEAMQPIIQYIKEHPDKFDIKTGAIKNSQFLDLWMQDETFRDMILTLYSNLLKGMKKKCDEKNVKMVVILFPITKFVSENDWHDAYFIGGDRVNYDFEKVHSPILDVLLKNQIEAYDITYELIIRHQKYFPFNAHSHHRSYLFHQALAESVKSVLTRNDFFNFSKDTDKKPNPIVVPVLTRKIVDNVFYTPKKDYLFILHDLTILNENRANILPSANALLKYAIEDIKRYKKNNEEITFEKFQVNFVNVKNRDEYGQRLLDNITELASLTIGYTDFKKIEVILNNKGTFDNEFLHNYFELKLLLDGNKK
ncbi:MAG: hypothetical protein GY710_02730 [Desulfobacteraceae bacterium]|nr:hypothetical protein [Desulfobacteraceae bacterium]